MAEIEDETELENSSSFWTSFTSRIGEMRLELRTLHPDVVGDAEKLQKIKLQLSGLQICKFLTKYRLSWSLPSSLHTLRMLLLYGRSLHEAHSNLVMARTSSNHFFLHCLFFLICHFFCVVDATESTPLLPAYDVRRSQEVRNSIQNIPIIL